MECVTTSITESPTWFGLPDHPLFGLLTTPTTGERRGAVVIAPPVGYEARNAKAALRQLALQLGRAGITSLRFDYRGTGDSSGAFGSSLPTPDWVDDIGVSVDYLKSAGFEQVSIVGMRLGATMATLSAWRSNVGVHAVVLWDPCESGRSYLREVGALSALRREVSNNGKDGSVETTEYLFDADMVASLEQLNLKLNGDFEPNCRYLLITRRSRPLSTAVLSTFESLHADFRLTDEQEACLQVLPFYAQLPNATIIQITQWLSDQSPSQTLTPHLTTDSRAVLNVGSDGQVKERADCLGPHRNFVMITEPVSGFIGPLLVMLQNVHEDHNGPSRMWVELSRQCALAGARSARIDVSGLGDSPRNEGMSPAQYLDAEWVREVVDVCVSLEPSDPSNVVFLGLCSGATLAIEAAWRLRARGLCIINPPLGINVLHHVTQWQDSRTVTGRRWGRRLRRWYLAHPWIVVTLWELFRTLRPSRWRADVIARLRSRGTDVLVLASLDQFSGFPRVPFVRKLDGRHPDVERDYPFELVPDLDHGLTVAAGRDRVAERFKRHLCSTFFMDATNNELGSHR